MNKKRDELIKKLYSGIKYIENLLNTGCGCSYDDSMRIEIATAIAVKLRVMLVDGGNNHSLLNQLGIKNKMLFQAECLDNVDMASNLIFSSQLTSLQLSQNTLFCIPKEIEFKHKLLCPFDVWWNEIVIDSKGKNFTLVTRGDVIKTLADQEGGAHEDPDHSEAYYRINFENGFKVIGHDGQEKRLGNNYYVETLFVVAREFLDAFSFFEEHIKGSKLEIEQTRFNLIQITYHNDEGKKNVVKNRYYPNSNENINIAIMMAFDHYRKAEYSLLYLKGFIYNHLLRDTKERYLVLDDGEKDNLVFLRALKGDEVYRQYVLLKKGNGYMVIKDDSEIYQKSETKPLSEHLSILSNRKPNLFDTFLEKQIIDY